MIIEIIIVCVVGALCGFVWYKGIEEVIEDQKKGQAKKLAKIAAEKKKLRDAKREAKVKDNWVKDIVEIQKSRTCPGAELVIAQIPWDSRKILTNIGWGIEDYCKELGLKLGDNLAIRVNESVLVELYPYVNKKSPYKTMTEIELHAVRLEDVVWF